MSQVWTVQRKSTVGPGAYLVGVATTKAAAIALAERDHATYQRVWGKKADGARETLEWEDEEEWWQAATSTNWVVVVMETELVEEEA